MVSLADADATKYLGVNVGLRRHGTGSETIESMKEDIIKISVSLLKPWQKVDAVKAFVLSRIGYAMRTTIVPRNKLNDIDRTLKQHLKK